MWSPSQGKALCDYMHMKPALELGLSQFPVPEDIVDLSWSCPSKYSRIMVLNEMKFRSLDVMKDAWLACKAVQVAHCTILGSTIHILSHHRFRWLLWCFSFSWQMSKECLEEEEQLFLIKDDICASSSCFCQLPFPYPSTFSLSLPTWPHSLCVCVYLCLCFLLSLVSLFSLFSSLCFFLLSPTFASKAWDFPWKVSWETGIQS